VRCWHLDRSRFRMRAATDHVSAPSRLRLQLSTPSGIHHLSRYDAFSAPSGVVGVVLLGPPGPEYPDPRSEHRRDVEHRFTGRDESLGYEIAEPVGRLDRPLAFLEPLSPLLEPLGLHR